MEKINRIEHIKSAIDNGMYLSIYDVTKLLEQAGIKNHGAYYSIKHQCLVIPVPGFDDVTLSKDYMVCNNIKFAYTETNLERIIDFVNSH